MLSSLISAKYKFWVRGQQTKSGGLGLSLFWVFCGSFLAFLLVDSVNPITDPDLWWHLKSGEMMMQTGGLLQADPFTFTGDGVVSPRETLILKGYWLWEIIAYKFYSLLGVNGIFLLNLLTVGAMAGVVASLMRRQRIGAVIAAPLMTLGFYLASLAYPWERPQVVSFLFAAILLGLLARVRDGGRMGLALPLLMMIWANLHGGFVVGDLILICFAIGAIIECRKDLPRMRHLLMWAAAGIGASLFNPNGGLVFSELFGFVNSNLMDSISEFQSTWVKFNSGSRFVALLWLLIVLYAVGLWKVPPVFLARFYRCSLVGISFCRPCAQYRFYCDCDAARYRRAITMGRPPCFVADSVVLFLRYVDHLLNLSALHCL